MASRGQPTEPEIIPPGQEPADWRRGQTDPWAQHNVYGTQRVFVHRIGPIGGRLPNRVGTARMLFSQLLAADDELRP